MPIHKCYLLSNERYEIPSGDIVACTVGRHREIVAIQPINMPNANIIITRQNALNILYPFTF